MATPVREVMTDGERKRNRAFSGRRPNSVTSVPIREKVYSSFYRLRYGWSFNSTVQFSNQTPVLLMGRVYIPDRNIRGRSEGVPLHVFQFMDHFYSLPWITYRCQFPPIPPNNLTTDCGWGCMVRSGQMLLATALHHHLLGRDWRLSSSDTRGHAVHRQILSWFGDFPSPLCPFSIHRLMEAAVSYNNKPGDWFGPSQVSLLIRDCIKRAIREHVNLQKLNIYVAYDCTVYVGDVEDIYQSDSDQSLLVMVPVRLGSEMLNPIYIPCVKSLLALDHSVGIIGGKPKHSVFFIGYQDDSLLHLDPHYSQSSVDMTRQDFDVSTYHCRTPKKIPVGKMDPSCTLGFYCHTFEDFKIFQQQAEKVLAPPLQRGHYPFFSFNPQRLNDIVTPDVSIIDPSPYRLTRTWTDTNTDPSDDEFVILDCVNDGNYDGDNSPPIG